MSEGPTTLNRYCILNETGVAKIMERYSGCILELKCIGLPGYTRLKATLCVARSRDQFQPGAWADFRPLMLQLYKDYGGGSFSSIAPSKVKIRTVCGGNKRCRISSTHQRVDQSNCPGLDDRRRLCEVNKAN